MISLAIVGALLGGQLNRAVYRWAWDSRFISPWSPKPQQASPRTWTDCLPIYGWWPLRREAHLHGRNFWIRPSLIELAWTIGLPWFYHWSVVQGGQLSGLAAPPGSLPRFFAHTVLLALLTIATFIDFDEKTIPDLVTIPGTLFALIFVPLFPSSLLPVSIPVEPLLLLRPWPPALGDTPPTQLSLWIAIGCWIGWCLALLPYTVYFRRGIGFGLKLLVGSIFHKKRRLITFGLLALLAAGTVAIALVWRHGGLPWQALLSSLVGLAVAGGTIWAIRIVAGSVLGVEAMGFGDVTLMFMIGAFLGWQASLVAFFFSPFTSIGIVLAQWLITGEKKIAFGPFLCAGTAIVLFCWADVWPGVQRYFEGPMAGIVIALLFTGIVLMGVMLGILQFIKRLLGVS